MPGHNFLCIVTVVVGSSCYSPPTTHGATDDTTPLTERPPSTFYAGLRGGSSRVSDSLNLEADSKDGYGLCLHSGYRPVEDLSLDISYLDSGTVVIGEIAPANQREAGLKATSLRAIINVHRSPFAPTANDGLGDLSIQIGGGFGWYELRETNFGVTESHSGWSRVSMYAGFAYSITSHLEVSFGLDAIVGMDRPGEAGGKAEFSMATLGMSYNF